MKFNKKLIVSALLLVTGAFILSGCGDKNKDGETADPGKGTEAAADPAKDLADNTDDVTLFKVGMECAYAPFNWTQSDDSNGAIPLGDGTYANGYDVQIARKIAEGLNKELVIVKTEWDGLPPALTSGKIDAVIAGMSATKERKEVLDFTNNYYTSDLVVVVKKDGAYANAKTKDDFKGAKITGQLNTFHYSVIDQLTGAVKEVAMSDFPIMTAALGSDKIDGYVSERPGALSAVGSNPNLTFVEFEQGKGFTYELDECSIAIGLSKDSLYLESINEILSGISEADRERLMAEAIVNQPIQ